MFRCLSGLNQDDSSKTATLSIQRRMRPAICDLTRSFYDDLVQIEDHPTCLTKKISGGSKFQGKGREVPGVLPNIFFWTHEGIQKRSSVGLSRVNHTEVDMVVNLCCYLVKTGVPPSSIAVLTPYKGQLMLLQRKLKDQEIFHFQPKRREPRRNYFWKRPSCRISTVDRFQGDEEDIVVCSTVLDEKSKTQFVHLQNRNDRHVKPGANCELHYWKRKLFPIKPLSSGTLDQSFEHVGKGGTH